jgi:hypothetical protein
MLGGVHVPVRGLLRRESEHAHCWTWIVGARISLLQATPSYLRGRLTKGATKYAKTVVGQVQSRSQSSGRKNLSELLSAFNFVTSGGRPGSVSDLSF